MQDDNQNRNLTDPNEDPAVVEGVNKDLGEPMQNDSERGGPVEASWLNEPDTDDEATKPAVEASWLEGDEEQQDPNSPEAIKSRWATMTPDERAVYMLNKRATDTFVPQPTLRETNTRFPEDRQRSRVATTSTDTVQVGSTNADRVARTAQWGKQQGGS